jgi:hypothetical protein
MKSHYGNWLLAGMTMLLTVIMTACSGGDGAGSAGSGSVSGVVSDIATGAPLAGVAVSDGTSSATTDTNAITTLNWALTKAHGAYVDYTNLLPSQMIPATARNDKYTILRDANRAA